MPTPNLGLELPTVAGDADTWGEKLNDNFGLIDSDNHTTHPIPTAGLNINADLDFDNNNATSLKSARLYNQVSVLAGGSDVLCVYAKSNDLYWNTSTGTPVRLTNGTAINAAGITTNAYEVQSVTGTHTIDAADTYDLLLVSTAAARTINLPLANAVASGRRFKIKDITGTAATNNITMVRAGSDLIEGVSGNKILATNYGGWELVGDGVSKWWMV